MGFPLDLALRYMGSRKRAFISLGTFFAIMGVSLGVAGLATAVSVTGGFRKQFQDKVLGVNAHVLVLKRSNYFGEYREIMDKVRGTPGVTGMAPFTINPMMVTKGQRTATGVLLKGVDPDHIGDVLDLPHQVQEGSFDGLRLPGAKPALPRSLRVTTKRAPDKLDTSGLLSEISKMIAADEKALSKKSPESLEPPKDVAPDEGGVIALDELPATAPRGKLAPKEGYSSVLPSDDVLPEALNPDPCAVQSSVLPGIVIGKTLGRNLAAKLGDCIQVTSPTIGYSYSGDAIRAPIAKQFRVIAIFDAGFDQYDAKLAYVDLYEAQQFYDSGDNVTGIEMRVADVDKARRIASQIQQNLEGALHYTMDWEELNHGLFTALHIQQIVMSLVLGLIIILAAFTVIATLIMVVLDKKREIAVIKAMGATDGAILRSFLYQGGIIGAVGGMVGLGFAYVVCSTLLKYAVPLDPKVYFISSLPVDMQPLQFLLVFIFAILVCVGATVWPALHAARLRPVEAFRER
jgi:lipoprotein-releasing system permease protein